MPNCWEVTILCSGLCYALCHQWLSVSKRRSASLGLCSWKSISFSALWGMVFQSQGMLCSFPPLPVQPKLVHTDYFGAASLSQLQQRLYFNHHHLVLWQTLTTVKALQILYDERSSYREAEDSQWQPKSKWKIQSMCFNCSNNADCLQNSCRVSTYSQYLPVKNTWNDI